MYAVNVDIVVSLLCPKQKSLTRKKLYVYWPIGHYRKKPVKVSAFALADDIVIYAEGQEACGKNGM